MSSAQAAATAAFKANKSGNSPPPVNSRRPSQLRLPTDNKRSSALLSPGVLKSGHKTTPGSSHTAKSIRSETPRVYGSSTPRSTRRSSDQYSVLSDNGDYFSLPTRTPEHEHSSANSSKGKITTSTNPKDMIDQVRRSISSKNKVGTLKEIKAKSQVSVNEFRQSLDQRRMRSQPASEQNSTAMLLEGLSPHHSSASLISQPSTSQSESELYQNYSSSKSHSSLGSAFSDYQDSDVPPPIMALNVGTRTPEEPPKRRASTPKEKVPIPVPPSSNALARSLAVTSDSMTNLSISGQMGQMASSSEALVTDSSDGKPKPGRKPPPMNVDSSFSSRVEMSARPSEEYEPRRSDSSEFPQYPDVHTKHRKKGIFSKKKKSVTGVVYDPPSSADDEDEDYEVRGPANPNTMPQGAANVVKLKTTMREKSKRKQLKTQFNEDKPWKNHGDLDHVSESQRKRYEGLWVSNKGSYIDHVATKLVGVNYKKEEHEEISKDPKKYTEKEISERAAKFSSQVSKDYSNLDIAHLHGLDNVDPQDLIHGVVVKRLWSRSKLPYETLRAIWDLVDFRKDGTLNKAEFIVGMWLVDQCLYGRKLPKVVSQSVWASVGGMGVSVVVKKKRR